MNDMLQKLEDRIIQLLEEMETKQSHIQELKHNNQALSEENERLKQTAEQETQKIESMLKLLDGVSPEEHKDNQSSIDNESKDK